jgi:hypothetical protein
VAHGIRLSLVALRLTVQATAVRTFVLMLAFMLCDRWDESARLQGVTRVQARAVRINKMEAVHDIREMELDLCISLAAF